MSASMRILFVGLAALACAGCDASIARPNVSTDPPDEELAGEPELLPLAEFFPLRDLRADTLWWDWPCCASQSGFPVDANGIPTLVIQGEVSYHPSYIAENALAYESSYRRSGNPFYRDGLLKWTAFLIQRADTLDEGAIYVPFDFNFALHGTAAETLHAPWYSGFSQGMFLSLLVRTARLTGDPAHADAAHRVFRSLADTHHRRVAHVDPGWFYWIDEYPSAQPDLTLNGHLYGMRGLYEYWQWQRTPESEYRLRAALTTMKQYAAQFRVPGQPSVYCLKHRVPAPAYHQQVVMLLREAHLMSGDDAFRQLADDFASDVP